jgi:hypothetical protein
MPEDYYPYIFMFEEETVDGYAKAIREALSHSEEELNKLGHMAAEFVIRNKNNINQAERILELISK